MKLDSIRIPDTYKILSGSLLKALALLCMTADHIGAHLMHPADGIHLVILGRLAFPIFAFLLAEGYTHTRSFRRYTFRLALLAVLSEVPFDLMISGTVWDWNNQNVMWTLLLGLCAMRLWDRFEASPLIEVPVCLAVVALGWVLNTDYGLWGAFIPLLFHLLRNQPGARVLAGAALSQNCFQAVAYIPVALYNGRRGFIRGDWKWAVYLYYPVHMLIIWAVSVCFGLPTPL